MSSALVSPSFIWKIAGKNNAYTVRRGDTTFSSHPLNPSAKMSPKVDGISNDSILSVVATETGIVILRKNKTQTNKPIKSISRVALKVHQPPRHGTKATLRQIKAAGRQDLSRTLGSRFHKVYRITHPKPVSSKFTAKKAASE